MPTQWDKAILFKMFNGASYMMAVTQHSIEVTKNGLKNPWNNIYNVTQKLHFTL